MKCSQRFREYLKTTRFVQLLLSIFEYFYIRWRVIRSVSTEINQDDDSLASSFDETERRKIVRTHSLYNPSCPNSMRDPAAYQKPGCIDVYRQFMNYGSIDSTIPGHIFLSNSASYYATSSTDLCELSKSISECSGKPFSSWSNEILQDSDLCTETSSVIDFDENSCRVYKCWMNCGSKATIKPRRLLPMTPTTFMEKSQSFPENEKNEKQNSQQWSFENYCKMASRGAETMTYSEFEEQRQIRNYFFTSPIYFENDDNRLREGARINGRTSVIEEQRKSTTPITPGELDEDSLEDSYLRESPVNPRRHEFPVFDEELESYGSSSQNESYLLSSEFASTEIPEGSNSQSSDYRTASISSPVAKEISDRFSRTYWRVEDHNGDDAIGARDNYHNRYFGKAGYYLTRNAIENQANGRDTMPAVERTSLQKERRRWTEINQTGGRYDNVELPFPDTNGRHTNYWAEEYEQPLPPHTSSSWKTPKRYVPRYTSLF